jgi:hypothetical protein
MPVDSYWRVRELGLTFLLSEEKISQSPVCKEWRLVEGESARLAREAGIPIARVRSCKERFIILTEFVRSKKYRCIDALDL